MQLSSRNLASALLLVTVVIMCVPAEAQQTNGPLMPTYFRAKARAWMHTSREPLLLLYHYDGRMRRSREDYYTLIDTFHKRFVSDFKDYLKGTKHWVFHKQPKAPRMCVVAPILHSFVDQAVLNTARFVGPASVTLSAESAAETTGAGQFPDANNNNSNNVNGGASKGPGSSDGSKGTVHCEHWRFIYDGRAVETCLLPPSGQQQGQTRKGISLPNSFRPVLIQHPMVRLEILDFQIYDEAALPPYWEHVFDAQRASKARCTAWD